MAFSPNQKEVRLEQLMPLFRQRLSQGQCFRFGPKGTSMQPMLRQGLDTVELSPLPERLKKYDLPLYQRKDGSFILHRIIRVSDTYTCMGDNQFDPEPGLEHSQMIGLVTAFYREDRRISVNAWYYKLYCRLWHYSRPIRKPWRRFKIFLRSKLKK